MNYYKGIFLVFLATFFFSFQSIFGYMAYKDGANVVGLLWIRFSFAAIFLQLYIFMEKKTASNRQYDSEMSSAGWKKPLAIGFVLAFGALNYFFTITKISIGLTILLFYMFPIYIFIVSIVMGLDKLSCIKSIAVVVAVYGVYISVNFTGEMQMIGIMTGLLSGICYGSYIMLSNRYLIGSKPFHTLAWVITGCALCVTVPLLLGMADFPMSYKGYLAALGLAIISTILSLFFLLKGSELMGKPIDVSIVSTMEIGSTFFLAWLILDEHIQINQLIGAALIFSAIIIMLLSPTKKSEQKELEY